MKKLVVGATGFIGSSIVRELLKDGEEVKVLFMKGRPSRGNLAGLDVEKAYGDIRDGDSIKKALLGCDTLYLAAAYNGHWAPNPKTFYEINLEGTKTALRAALEAGVQKVVYTSSNNAVAASGLVEADEERTFNSWEAKDHYTMSKYIAENEARILAIKGLPIVIVNPTLVIGANDSKPSPSGRTILDIVEKKMPGYIDGGLNIIDVEDVARGHILAAKKGKLGERYLLGNENITVRDYLNLIAGIAGVKPPSIKLPFKLALALGHLFEFGSSITKKPPLVTSSEVRIAKMMEWYNCSKAVKELGLPQTPIDITVKKTINWFRENGYTKK
ncbi:putative hopanoid-associated sugar epimerase [Leptospira broomii serovar Hurstbridge str. 5399]|uniref:Hopanoid-associated sugar epimerase n=1 Tax=Leptospira broomii serovar Hurstbridge str. 5399 TaxID=1049789 RepID=T0GIL5_9LEPT|nr:NAD-dependent epimerase/dehydratase family protein [Leptospira broomii]EQA46664.1 putative hopanoid-associated sugar epimerase [Leptospira broomii serovar Hurstbridge str. 5399]